MAHTALGLWWALSIHERDSCSSVRLEDLTLIMGPTWTKTLNWGVGEREIGQLEWG